MTPKPKPQADDGPEPSRTTPRRLGRELKSIALAAASLRMRVLAASIYVDPYQGQDPNDASPRDVLDELARLFAQAADKSTCLGASVEVGEVLLDERWLDVAYRPERPLLDVIEGRPMQRRAAAIAETVEARGDTDPAWTDGAPAPEPLPPAPPEYPPAKSARANRRKAKQAAKTATRTKLPTNGTTKMRAALDGIRTKGGAS